MPAEIILSTATDDTGLTEKRERLAAIRALLAERESELAQLRAQLAAFEGRYLRQVGILYAELDEIEARIANRESLRSGSEEARRLAEEARQRAQQSHEAAYGEAAEAPEFTPPPNLKTLFREVAKRIHPDFARDDDEGKYFTLLMARANQAYARGDVETLQRLLDDHREINTSLDNEGTAAEILRLSRQIRHAERDIATLDFDLYTLRSSEAAQLFADAEAAALQHRDLLAELAAKVRRQIDEAQCHLRQMEQQTHA